MSAGGGNSEQVLIAGSCIAAMIAALELGKNGTKVALVNPTPAWGGHFSSKLVAGSHFDLGMVGFEFTGFHKNPTRDVEQYDPKQRNNVARFCGLSQEYVESLIPVHQSRTPLMHWHGEVHSDVLMGNDLSILKRLEPRLLGPITEEVGTILRESDRSLHPATKVNNPAFLSSSYERASLACHGKTFHSLFIEPFANKLFPGGAGRFSALYHRCLWMPLYYPETLLAATGPNPHDITTLFHYPAAGRVGALAETLLDRIKSTGNVRIVPTGITSLTSEAGITLHLTDGTTISGRKLIWGMDLPHLMKVSGLGEPRHQDHQTQKTSAAFGFFVVERKKLKPEFSSLFVLDPTRLIYRITNLSDSGGTNEERARLVLELNSHYFDGGGEPDRFTERAAAELVELGFVDSPADIHMKQSLYVPKVIPIPNEADHCMFWESRGIVDRAWPQVDLIGPASGYLITTLNDQVIQGLKSARQATLESTGLQHQEVQ